MTKKKAYILPETTVIDEGSYLMVTASGGSGDINFTYDDEEGNAYDEGKARKNSYVWDSDDDTDCEE